MNNPAPRPALRKAPDADIHPAIPQTDQATIDLRAATQATPAIKHEVSVTSTVPEPKKAEPKKDSTKKALVHPKAHKRKAKRIALRVKVPRSVRSQLRATAKARGTSVDDVVSTVLEGWLDK